MIREAGQLDKETLEEALCDALKSVLRGIETGVNPRVKFYNTFQREMDEHDRDFEKKYEHLNTTLIFSGLFSVMTSAFIIDIQSELKPNYEEMNNALLEMLLNATTGNPPAGSAAALPRWAGPDPVIVQVQCILYATLSATLLASFLAMLGRQWVDQYGQSETRGSTADMSRWRERKLSGIETWKFHVVVGSLPLILQCALVLLVFSLSRYLWGVNRSVSSVVIGFTSFAILFYLAIVTASILSFDCPFQTPLSPMVRSIIDQALPYWRNLRRTFGPKRQPLQPRTPGERHDLPFSANAIGRGHELEASITTLACIAPAVVQFPWSVTPLFSQGMGGEVDRLDVRCLSRMYVMSTDVDVVTSIMDFIPEIIWHGGIENLPLKCIYGILMDCFDFSGPALTRSLRDVAYLSARAFTHIALQRRCITQYKEDERDGWKALCANHPLLSPVDYDPDSDLETVLFMVDMTLGYDGAFPWNQAEMTPRHHAWMSHVFLYHAWYEKRVSEVVMDFVEHSMSLRLSSDIVVTDCLFIIGLMIGIPLHVGDITKRDKSCQKAPALWKIFGVLSTIFSSRSIQTPSALHALRLITRLATVEVSNASYELFKAVMAAGNMTDQHWEAARLAICGAYKARTGVQPSIMLGELGEILKFLDHHLRLRGSGENHETSIISAIEPIIVRSQYYRADPITVECIGNFILTSPSFTGAVRSLMRPDTTIDLRLAAIGLIALASEQWFDSTTPVEEMSEFCEHLAVFVNDTAIYAGFVKNCGAIILFEILRSPEWRKHITTRFWSTLAYSTQLPGEPESFRWCLQNAIELLEFTRGLPDGEGLKWWYGTLWFHYDKLDATAQVEVERIAKDISLGDGLSDLNLYLNLIEREVARIRREVDESHDEIGLDEPGMKLRTQLITLEENHRRLARITGR